MSRRFGVLALGVLGVVRTAYLSYADEHYSDSKRPAAPMPVPMHIVTIPYFFLCREPMHQCSSPHGARGAERVSQRNRTAERIDLSAIDP